VSESSVKTAKVYVLKDPDMGDPEYDWKVCTEVYGIITVVKDCATWSDAWTWLEENYVRETP
jgi:hypothetical protein